MSEEKNTIEKLIPKSRKRDPLIFIIWGLLLLFYGLYRFYQVIMAIEKLNNVYLSLIEPIIMTVFSMIVLFFGFNRKNIS